MRNLKGLENVHTAHDQGVKAFESSGRIKSML